MHEDRKLFEFLILEGAQAGLSWDTILHKRENYRKAFDGFDPERIARYDRRKTQRLLRESRHRPQQTQNCVGCGQCEGVSASAKRVWKLRPLHLAIRRRQAARERAQIDETGSRADAESDAMSKDLKKRGFKFVGSTICYAFMQAVGMVNDHVVTCFRYKRIT